MAEQLPLKQLVEGSNPPGVTSKKSDVTVGLFCFPSLDTEHTDFTEKNKSVLSAEGSVSEIIFDFASLPNMIAG